MNKNIYIIINNDGISGSEKRIISVWKSLVEKGHKIYLVISKKNYAILNKNSEFELSSNLKKKIIKNNIDYIFLKIDNLFLKILKKISHIIYLIVRSLIYNYHLKCIINKKDNIKLIHFPNYGFLQLFYKNAKIKTSCRISSLEYLWNSNKNYIYLFFTSYLEKKCLKKANIIFTPSTFLKKKLYQRFNLNSYYLPQIYEESKIKKTKIKKKFILIIGSISSGKGGDYIADNINNILPSSMNLIWIGNIDKNYISSHREYQKKLKNKLKENLNRKIYIKKFIKQNKLMEDINSSSLVLLFIITEPPSLCTFTLTVRKRIMSSLMLINRSISETADAPLSERKRK